MENSRFAGKIDSFLFYAGILLVSLSSLLLEITLTRILSIMIWYHFAFMVISVVLLGFGASGTFLSLSRTAKRTDTRRLLNLSSMLFSFSILLSFIILRKISLDPFQMISDKSNFFFLFILYFLLIIPFFFAGTTIGTAFMRHSDFANRIYFADLLGASLGCVSVVVLIGVAGGPGCVVLSSMVAAAAAFLFAMRLKRRSAVVPALLIFIVGGIVFPFRGGLDITPCPSKQYSAYLKHIRNGPLEIKFSEWNPISRIDVIGPIDRNLKVKFGLYTVSRAYRGTYPRQMFLTIDGDAGTILHNFDGDYDSVGMLDYSLYPAAYLIKKDPEALIIGLGGGTDILTALKYNVSEITGVEINPSIIKVGSTVMDEFVGGIFNNEKVTIVNSEGRSFVRHSDKVYDVIQMTGVDTWSALASGAYTLSENYLYTVDAMEDYIRHLKDDGVVSIIRFVFNPPRETLRLCSLAIAALENMGLGNARDHIAILTNGSFAGFLLKKTPFLDHEKKTLIRYCKERGLGILYMPGMKGGNAFYQLLLSPDRESFYSGYRYNITPVTDDRPFFYKYYKWKNLSFSTEGFGGQIGANLPMGKIVVLAVLLQSALLSVIFILLPLYLRERSGLGGKGRGRVLVYFAGLGAGFMFLEITVIQKFILFLGHPTYSISVVLFSILLGCSLGSLVSSRMKSADGRMLTIAITGIALLTLFHILVIPHLFEALLGIRHVLRIALSIVFIVPLGFFMGIPFPVGLRAIGRTSPQMVAWAWGVNGCLSVIGSILSVLISMRFGFNFVMIAAVVVYFIALLSMSSYLERVEPQLDL